MNNVKETWTSEAGPRQTKTISKAFSAIKWAGKSVIEVYGTVGKPETERRSIITSFCGDVRSDATEGLAAIGNSFDWTITKENYAQIVKACEQLKAEVIANMPEEDKRITAEVIEDRAAMANANAQKCRDRDTERKTNQEAITAKAPPWAKALIVAELVEDDSDIQSDYFASHQTRSVAIGWRKSKKEDFKALRKAAANFEPTAHMGPGLNVCRVRPVWDHDSSDVEAKAKAFLGGDFSYYKGQTVPQHFIDNLKNVFASEAEADVWLSENESPAGVSYQKSIDDSEHRENYSMGAGNYLKAGGRDDSGWRVKSVRLPFSGYEGPFEDHLPE
jgi:hypothetical protein